MERKKVISISKPPPPPCLDGFQHIERKWDSQFQAYVANVKPGDFYITNNSQEMIKTLLGSCVSACIRDKRKKIGGLNHFLLPLKDSVYNHKFKNILLTKAARYGNWAMEYLINEILKHGGIRRNLEIKVFGGSTMLKKMTDIGEQNINFILQYIYNENLVLQNQDLGGNYPRIILYSPHDGIVKVKKVNTANVQEIIKEEESYLQQISTSSTDGEAELF